MYSEHIHNGFIAALKMYKTIAKLINLLLNMSECSMERWSKVAIKSSTIGRNRSQISSTFILVQFSTQTDLSYANILHHVTAMTTLTYPTS